MDIFITRGQALTGHASEVAPTGPTKWDVSTSSRTSGTQGPTAQTQAKSAHVSATNTAGQELAAEEKKSGAEVTGSAGTGKGGASARAKNGEDEEMYEEANTGVTMEVEPELEEDEPTQVPRAIHVPKPDWYLLPGDWGFSASGDPMSPTTMAQQLKEQNRHCRKASSWIRGQGDGPSISLGQAAQKASKPGGNQDKDKTKKEKGKAPERAQEGKKKEPEPEPEPTPSEAESGGNFSETVPGDHVPHSAQALWDYEMLINIMYNEECWKAVTEMEEFYQEMKRCGCVEKEKKKKKTEEEKPKTPENKGTEGAKEEKKMPKARPSLGISFKDLEGEKSLKKNAHIPTGTPTKTGTTHGMPTGGYLHNKLNDKDEKKEEKESGPPTRGGGNPGGSDDEDNGDNRKGGSGGGGGSDGSGGSDSSIGSDSSNSEEDPMKMTPKELKQFQKKLKKKLSNKKHKERLRKLQLSRFKTKLPSTYVGNPDYDVFEQFMYKVETWVEDTGFEEKDVVRHVKGFLKDKAASFYMDHVAPEITKYMMKKLFQELFKYCFPPDIKARLRWHFMSLHQLDHGFKDFTRQLKKYQQRLVDITDELVIQRMWEGAHHYIRIEWVRAGYLPEENTMDEMEESAIRFENAEKLRRVEENRTNE
ncbi:hypothetical protein FRC11_004054 [Ceratobasidium sp. 423]|nr:hypothetical protein FRC11_004054 [Ceratobasidium sp. 423]